MWEYSLSALIIGASGLRTWLHFVVFTVIPIAAGQIVNWLYQWQILEAGLLVVLAAYIGGRALVRAARIIALAPRPLPPAKPVGARTAQIPDLAPSEVGGLGCGDDSRRDLSRELYRLRERIRATLSKLPSSDAPLSAESRKVCSHIADFVPDEVTGDEKARRHYEALCTELNALKSLDNSTTCRMAWEALVRVNSAARSLLEITGERDTSAV